MVCPTDAASTALVLPHFPVEIAAPDLSPWLAGNTGTAGVHSFAARAPGPHVAIFAVTHGNEIAGAIVLDRLLRAGLRPACGRLSLVFSNLDAYARFDPQQPTASRFVDEDLNRLWDEATLRGARESTELLRARALLPLVDTVDVLLDLHSMLWPSDPLILCGTGPRGGALARAMGVPPLVVADAGHLSGRRLIDYPRFADPDATCRAVLVEAGQHWQEATVTMCAAAVDAVLRITGIVAGAHPAPDPPARFAEVTATITAGSGQFSFVKDYHGGEVIARRNTVIALDGETEIRTPYDDCLLVMPSLRPSRGHTAVRLAHFV
jgi:predicted deacylase